MCYRLWFSMILLVYWIRALQSNTFRLPMVAHLAKQAGFKTRASQICRSWMKPLIRTTLQQWQRNHWVQQGNQNIFRNEKKRENNNNNNECEDWRWKKLVHKWTVSRKFSYFLGFLCNYNKSKKFLCVVIS